jgi:hypothetical protein
MQSKYLHSQTCANNEDALMEDPYTLKKFGAVASTEGSLILNHAKTPMSPSLPDFRNVSQSPRFGQNFQKQYG